MELSLGYFICFFLFGVVFRSEVVWMEVRVFLVSRFLCFFSLWYVSMRGRGFVWEVYCFYEVCFSFGFVKFGFEFVFGFDFFLGVRKIFNFKG